MTEKTEGKSEKQKGGLVGEKKSRKKKKTPNRIIHRLKLFLIFFRQTCCPLLLFAFCFLLFAISPTHQSDVSNQALGPKKKKIAKNATTCCLPFPPFPLPEKNPSLLRHSL